MPVVAPAPAPVPVPGPAPRAGTRAGHCSWSRSYERPSGLTRDPESLLGGLHLAEAGAHDGARWRQHLRHARAALGPLIPDHYHRPLRAHAQQPIQDHLHQGQSRACPLVSTKKLFVIHRRPWKGKIFPCRIVRDPASIRTA